MPYEPQWQWLHDKQTEYKGIVEYLADLCDPDINKAKALGLLISVLIVVIMVDRGFEILNKHSGKSLKQVIWESIHNVITKPRRKK